MPVAVVEPLAPSAKGLAFLVARRLFLDGFSMLVPHLALLLASELVVFVPHSDYTHFQAALL